MRTHIPHTTHYNRYPFLTDSCVEFWQGLATEKTGKPRRALFAACSIGLEPYAFLIKGSKKLPSLDTRIEQDYVHAVDIDAECIEFAKEARYPFTNIAPLNIPDEDAPHLIWANEPQCFLVSEEVRSKVSFSCEDILRTTPVEFFDLTVCMALLLHLDTTKAQMVIDKLFDLTRGICVIGLPEQHESLVLESANKRSLTFLCENFQKLAPGEPPVRKTYDRYKGFDQKLIALKI